MHSHTTVRNALQPQIRFGEHNTSIGSIVNNLDPPFLQFIRSRLAGQSSDKIFVSSRTIFPIDIRKEDVSRCFYDEDVLKWKWNRSLQYLYFYQQSYWACRHNKDHVPDALSRYVTRPIWQLLHVPIWVARTVEIPLFLYSLVVLRCCTVTIHRTEDVLQLWVFWSLSRQVALKFNLYKVVSAMEAVQQLQLTL